MEAVESVGIDPGAGELEIHTRAQGIEWVARPLAVEGGRADPHAAIDEVAEERVGLRQDQSLARTTEVQDPLDISLDLEQQEVELVRSEEGERIRIELLLVLDVPQRLHVLDTDAETAGLCGYGEHSRQDE